jgi:transcriptional repressor NrdR
MKCPYCEHLADKVVDSRESKEGDVIRRRRQCLECGRRFTSYERIDQIPYMVVKKEGRRERFDRQKVLAGLLKACEKRPVSVTQLEQIVDEVEQRLHESANKEIAADQIGEFVMLRMKGLDQVAYVRFASVYRDFKDAAEFVETIRGLLDTQDR